MCASSARGRSAGTSPAPESRSRRAAKDRDGSTRAASRSVCGRARTAQKRTRRSARPRSTQFRVTSRVCICASLFVLSAANLSPDQEPRPSPRASSGRPKPNRRKGTDANHAEGKELAALSDAHGHEDAGQTATVDHPPDATPHRREPDPNSHCGGVLANGRVISPSRRGQASPNICSLSGAQAKGVCPTSVAEHTVGVERARASDPFRRAPSTRTQCSEVVAAESRCATANGRGTSEARSRSRQTGKLRRGVQGESGPRPSRSTQAPVPAATTSSEDDAAAGAGSSARASLSEVPAHFRPAGQSTQQSEFKGEVASAQAFDSAKKAGRSAQRAAPNARAVGRIAEDEAPGRASGRRKQSTGSRNWCFAASPVSADTLAALASWSRGAPVKYIVFGHAVCPCTQMPFLSGYVEFARPFRAIDVSKRPVSNSWLWTVRRGDPMSAAARCKSSRLHFEHGVPSWQRMRTRKKSSDAPAVRPFLAVADRIRQHCSWRSVLEDRELRTTVSRYRRWARDVFEASQSCTTEEQRQSCAHGWQRAVLTFLLGTAPDNTVHWFEDSAGEHDTAGLAKYLIDHVGAYSITQSSDTRTTAYRGEGICVATISDGRMFHEYWQVRRLKRECRARDRNSPRDSTPSRPPHVLVFAPHPPIQDCWRDVKWHVVNLTRVPLHADVEHIFPARRFRDVRKIWQNGDPFEDFLRQQELASDAGDASPQSIAARAETSATPSRAHAAAQLPEGHIDSPTAAGRAAFCGARPRSLGAIDSGPCWECLDEGDQPCPM